MKEDVIMKKEINISDSEWTVMEYLWDNPMVTITEIRKALSSTGWSDSTIKTLVRRLVSKNAVAINDEAATFRYYPLLTQQECRLKETKSFINRVYDGSVSMLVTNLAADSNLSERETEELLALIEKMGKE
jgi:BlaI family penicillinase repressor